MADITLTTSGIVYDGAGFATMNASDRIQCAQTGLNATQSWTAFRVRPLVDSATAPVMRILTFGPDTNEEVLLQWNTSSQWRIRRETAGVSTDVFINDNFVSGDKRTLIYAWIATEIKHSLNGAVFVSVSNTTISSVGSVDLDFGSRGYAGTEQFLGDFFWVLGGTGILTDADASTIHGYGDTDPPQSGLPGNATLLWPAASDIGQDLRFTPNLISMPMQSGLRW